MGLEAGTYRPQRGTGVAWLGAAAMLLVGIRVLGGGLEAWAAAHAGRWLREASTPWAALAAGLLVTAALQSSSATTVLVVGAAHAGWLDDAAAFMAVIGANVGTAVGSQLWAAPTPWLAPLLYAVAAALLLSGRGKEAGWTALGAALVLDALDRVEALTAPLAAAPGPAAALIRAGSDPPAAFLAGLVVTAAIDSSTASVALAQRLAEAGAVPLGAALYFTYGADVGTTAGTLLASLPLGPAARRAACGHLAFNLLAAAAFWPLTDALARLLGAGTGSPARAVAHAHVLLNLVPALAVLAWRDRLVGLLRRLVP